MFWNKSKKKNKDEELTIEIIDADSIVEEEEDENNIEEAEDENHIEEPQEDEGKIEEDFDDEKKIEEVEEQEETDMIEGEEPKGHRLKFWFKLIVGVVGAIVLLYLAACAYFSFNFYYGTTIDGKDYSLKQADTVQADQEAIVEAYELTIIQVNGDKSVINAKDAGIKYEKTEEIESILQNQNPFMWPTMFWNTFTYETTIQTSYEEEQLKEAVMKLDCMDKDNMMPPIDAYPKLVGEVYEAVSQEYGTELVGDQVVEKAMESIASLTPELNLVDAGCYVEPKIKTDSPTMIELIDNLNRFVKATITYKEGIVCDGKTIGEWLVVQEDNTIVLDEEKIAEYVKGLAETYNTVGKTRKFVSGSGRKVEVVGGTYGWRVDEEEEIALIIESLKAGKPTTREIEYSRRAVSHEGLDWGNSYAEIDLTNQKVYYTKAGKVVLSADVVTGDVSEDNATPQGVYPLTYKTKNAVLRGKKLPDGTYAYESPVSYWMPFNGGIGMHDASWRSTFGGEIYKNNGSHGCINMNYDTAQAMYGYVSSGDPIICYY